MSKLLFDCAATIIRMGCMFETLRYRKACRRDRSGQTKFIKACSMTHLTTSELRGYQQICGRNGAIMVIACDQRGGIRKILADTPEERAKISDAMLGDTKSDVVRYLASQAPCVLLDPVCAVPRVVEEGVLPRDVALLIGLDASGYDTDADGHYLSRLAPGINARKVRELGGTGGKIMVYLRADHPKPTATTWRSSASASRTSPGRICCSSSSSSPTPFPARTRRPTRRSFPSLIEGGTRLCLDAGAKVLKLPYPARRNPVRRSPRCAVRFRGRCSRPASTTKLSWARSKSPWRTARRASSPAARCGRIAFLSNRARQREMLVSKAVPRLKQIQAILERYPRNLATGAIAA